MKNQKVIVLVVLTIFAMRINAQAIIGKSYLTVANNIEVEYEGDTTKYKVQKGTKFSVDGFESGTDWVYVSFWNYGTNRKSIGKEAKQISLIDILGPQQKQSLLGMNSKDSVRVKTLLDSIWNTELDSAYVADVLRKQKHEITDKDIRLKLSLNKKYIGMWANHLQFKMKLTDLNDKAIEYHGKAGSFTYGVMTLPIKMRFGNGGDRLFNFEENLNLGFTFGYKRQPQSRVKQSHNFLGSVGVSRVELTEDSLNTEMDLEDDTASGIMLSAGYLYQYEAFQVGLFFGTDLLTGSLSREWKFQGKPWLGVAIGVSLFSNDTDKVNKGTN